MNTGQKLTLRDVIEEARKTEEVRQALHSAGIVSDQQLVDSPKTVKGVLRKLPFIKEAGQAPGKNQRGNYQVVTHDGQRVTGPLNFALR